MLHLLSKWWKDEDGCVLAVEWVFVASILTLGGIAGLLALSNAVDPPSVDLPAPLVR
jgi:Flp pilus assembly pilin Flp